MPAAGPSGSCAGLTTPGAEAGIRARQCEDSDWVNEINASCLLGTLFYKPRAAAAQITCPTLVLAPTEDEECPVAGARAVARAGETVELVEFAG
ncbi:hypothetical protein BD626DRAFT_497282, partial [Schizophyllum amplum]